MGFVLPKSLHAIQLHTPALTLSAVLTCVASVAGDLASCDGSRMGGDYGREHEGHGAQDGSVHCWEEIAPCPALLAAA